MLKVFTYRDRYPAVMIRKLGRDIDVADVGSLCLQESHMTCRYFLGLKESCYLVVNAKSNRNETIKFRIINTVYNYNATWWSSCHSRLRCKKYSSKLYGAPKY